MTRMDHGAAQAVEVNDAARVAQAQAGDREAFRLLVERHSHTIFRLAFRMTGNEYDADEIVQDTFLRAYRRLDRFEARANFGTWLYRIAVNCSLDLMRKRKTEAQRRVAPAETGESDGPDALDEMSANQPTPDRLVLSREVGRHVAVALAALSPVERAAFELRHFEGLSIEEIGRTLGLRESATKNSVFRAVQKLRKALEPLVRRNR